MVDKPTFKPDKAMGEGVASKQELSYRQDLLTLLKDVHIKWEKIKKDDKTVSDKITELDNVIEEYITKGQALIEESIKEAYNSGATDANDKLRKLGAKTDAIIPDNPERLQDLIRQQKENLEDLALILRGRLRQTLNIDSVMGYYG